MKRQKSKANHHLILVDGTWYTRFTGRGRDDRRSTGCPRSEVAAARLIRDQRQAELAKQRAGVVLPGRPVSLGELLALYVASEVQPYDRAKGGEQPGTQRGWADVRVSVERLGRHLSPNLAATAVDREALLNLARSIAREDPPLAAATRKKPFALLRQAFNWARVRPRQTGVTRSPFADLTRADRKVLFPPTARRGFLYEPELLRKVYAELPDHVRPFVRFAAHTAMRLREITTLVWENVDLKAGVAHVEERYAKNKLARDVALGDVAVEILRQLPPRETGHVFLNSAGRPLAANTVTAAFSKAVLACWSPARPSERRPRFHDLRKTCATRVEAVSSHAVAKLLLGHVTGDVTDTYLLPTLDAVKAALNRAARAIDGEPPAGTLPFTKVAYQVAVEKRA
jgi:integrase